jgi:hypothetical protein
MLKPKQRQPWSHANGQPVVAVAERLLPLAGDLTRGAKAQEHHYPLATYRTPALPCGALAAQVEVATEPEEGAGELEEPQVVAGFLIPTDQDGPTLG